MYKYGFFFEVCGNDIRLVMKAKGFVCFWMVEYEYYFKGESPKCKEFQR